jgi:predicted transcriptional regulator/RimJ/RimL family protein N-acetyltransferase
MPSSAHEAVLVLSIRPDHAERIFSGIKSFEIRKAVPKQPFSRVFLYATGGRGIVGCFDADTSIKAPVAQLWKIVGEKGTTRHRFFRYFANSKVGFGIPVRNPVRFRKAVCPPSLKRQVPQFTAPMSYLLVRPGQPLYRTLEQKRRKESEQFEVELRQLRKADRKLFVQVVTSEIAPKYDEITENFARSILRSHQIGFDPNGIFTTRKLAFSVIDSKGRLVGFTTITYKIGGCAKTGPTVILPRFRHKGYGLATRRALLKLATRESIRKLYCTCPDNDPSVIAYLLRSGFRIEAHLQNHYSPSHGELVFGRFVRARTKPLRTRIDRKRIRARALECISRESLAAFLRRGFSETWHPMTRFLAKSIVSTGGLLKGPYEEKPCRLLCFGKGTRCVALTLVVPKRGGAVKALLLSDTRHRRTLRSLVNCLETQLRAAGKRKVYFVHPSDDHEIVNVLKSCSYNVEGLLQEPYRKGQDAVVLAKMLF